MRPLDIPRSIARRLRPVAAEPLRAAASLDP